MKEGMKAVLKVWGALALLTLIASLCVGAAVYVWGLPEITHTRVSIDGTSFTIGAPSDWLIGLLGVALALLIVVTVVPLVVALALSVAAFGLAIGLAGAALGVLIPLSPFLLIVWLIWRGLRGPRPVAPAAAEPPRAVPPGATIAG